MKAHRQTRPSAATATAGRSRLQAFVWFLAATLIMAALLLAGSARADDSATPQTASPRATERVDLILNVAALPQADRARVAERQEAVRTALDTKQRLFRSFDARETLAETLAALALHGADTGPSATVNYDSIELDIPQGARAGFAALPFVKRLRTPSQPIPAQFPDSASDSEWGGETPSGLGYYAARTAGVRGAGVTVAILDTNWDYLDVIIADTDDHLPDVPAENRFKQKTSAISQFFEGGVKGNPNGMGEREHGPAILETLSEVVPDSEFLLYGIKSAAGIEAAIEHAADQGADVIVVALTHMETMSDPVGLLDGGTNRFTDDINSATVAGATVVVSAGNEGLRTLNTTFTPCTQCYPWDSDEGDDGICNTANDDTRYHTFATDYHDPLLSVIESFDHEAGYYENGSWTVTCMTAIEESPNWEVNDFKWKVMRFPQDPPPLDYEEIVCPRDEYNYSATPVARNLGEANTFPADLDWEDERYAVVVYRNEPNVAGETPNFRIMCTPGIEFENPDLDAEVPASNSLSDLAVVETALTIAAGDNYGVTDYSSRGDTSAQDPAKPDLSGPWDVLNYVVDYAFIELSFEGTSAAAAHAAGLVALIQSRRIADGDALFTPAEIKQQLRDNAYSDADDSGVDALSGAGFMQLPAWVADVGPTPTPSPSPTPSPTPTASPSPTPTPVPTPTPDPGTVVLDAPPGTCYVGATETLTGFGFSEGSVVNAWVSTSTGPQKYGPFDTTFVSSTEIEWLIPASINPGRGFVTVQIINTDEGFIKSNVVGAPLASAASLDLPTITQIDGADVQAPTQQVPLGYVETSIQQDTGITVDGTGFANPIVNLFTSTGKLSIVPEAGGTDTSFTMIVPAAATTGPGALQVINRGAGTPWPVSAAVSVSIGAEIDITGITVTDGRVYVTGSGFSPLTVINLFNRTPGGVVNLGGRDAGGNDRITLENLTGSSFDFPVPAGAASDRAYLTAINPPFITYSSTATDPDGAFTFP